MTSRISASGHSALAVATLVGVVLAVLVATTGPAAAHASVLTTTPTDGQSVPESPAEFTVTFSEPVDVELGGLSVLDGDGNRVDDGETVTGDGGRVLRVALRPDLDEGTYVGTWRVVSTDGHAISGSVLFAVGVPVDAAGVSGLSARTDPTWEVIGAVARFVTFVAALLAAGLAFYLAFLHDQRSDRWSIAPIVRIAALTGLFGIGGSIAAQAALATGRGLDAVTDLDVIRTVLVDTLGWSAVVLLVGLALVHLSTDTNRLLLAQGCAFYGGLAVTVSFVLWGHAIESPYRWLSVLSDGTHVAAAAIWFGGLVGLALTLRHRASRLAGEATPDPPAVEPGGGGVALSTRPEVETTTAPRRELLTSTLGVLDRFSTAAAVSVVVLLVSGVAMTWIQSGGDPTALWSTTYGRLLLTKVGLVVVVLALAAHNRYRLVPRLTTNDDEPGPAESAVEATAGRPADPGTATADWRRLRSNVLGEVVVLLAALAVTAVLVNVVPARNAVASAASVVELTAPADDGTVTMTVTPAAAGVNTIRVQYLDEAGGVLDVATTLRAEFSLPAAGLGPIAREVVKVGPGSFVLEGSELSIPGEWEIDLVVRPSDFRELRTPFAVEIR
ncbi:MAG: copper resistance protein CopC/CopD [Acidimicrobiales bacterium]|nr:copper resistance protein CopC/CopD [Acidimicrobiales bacterium]